MTLKKLPFFWLIAVALWSCKKNYTPSIEEKKQDTLSISEKESATPEETEVWEPEPRTVSFLEHHVPSDAIVLFDGSDISAWVSTKDTLTIAGWTITPEGTMMVLPGAGDIQTKQHFGRVQLHLEWSAPDTVVGEGQERGNSGIFFQDRYEVQILDSYQNRTYSNGQAASIYKQYIPLVNATTPPDQWQTYDIVFHPPEFDLEGTKRTPGFFTVFHNGVLVQDHVEILGTTEYIGNPKNKAHRSGPIRLQDHGNPVQFRNIWIREL